MAIAYHLPGYGFITLPVNDNLVPDWLCTQGIVSSLFGDHHWAQVCVLGGSVALISTLSWLLGRALGVREVVLLPVVAC